MVVGELTHDLLPSSLLVAPALLDVTTKWVSESGVVAKVALVSQ